MTAQSMHEVIHRLEQDGLIERNPHPDHGRKLPASLTAKGRRILSACEAAVADFEVTMLKGFSKSDRSAFLNALKSAVQNLRGGFGDAAGAAAAENALRRGAPASGRSGLVSNDGRSRARGRWTAVRTRRAGARPRRSGHLKPAGSGAGAVRKTSWTNFSG